MRPLTSALLLALGCASQAPASPTTPEPTPAEEPAPDATEAAQGEGFLARRARHETVLVTRGPSPQPYDELESTELAQVVRYESDGRELIGLLANGEELDPARPRPALLYLHGGWALGPSDVADCRPFLEAGWVVFAPAFRGENGNPGHHELYYGELDDARAALAHLKAIPGVDAEHVAVFGHSAGGILAGMLALYPDLGVMATGSAGGSYDERLFEGEPQVFEDTPIERSLRVWAPHADELQQPHFACVGEQDGFAQLGLQVALETADGSRAPLIAVLAAGNHFSSLATCMEGFYRLLTEPPPGPEADAAEATPAETAPAEATPAETTPAETGPRGSVSD
ncbi:MAG TPA: prolyl oligopeptidase family serine peptidase [Polyangiaceae bacterium LLY-WYZ-15_(1-7)]|nr:prolyl oligopeptidase family serine peptidase [Polyangiaceae bacterium LLY-WYZ-15_(1-7)]HJL05906.1 prolyl oligopeptidase family serine peptidase [Polyangiaceae bacterium LLY-WYZ-15_(1-7)]HJL08201.1 prolyl oligopeptidase family serine peptidase [Polyangiaceae bacterium LLY-WYZ-15_(1-7)]HJL21040.1 prolyl oligopeptidase family serine peptidase [Polyangiaceae bacterium LLY-WYZ-15_(1-7)]HJL28518.1 prolyl oligopeptidase family serine peptidase [Polyangiaceae bacterium LLY-WYZ-15_(1-7)]